MCVNGEVASPRRRRSWTAAGGAAAIACSGAGGGVMSTSTDRQTFREAVAAGGREGQGQAPHRRQWAASRVPSSWCSCTMSCPRRTARILVGSSRDPLAVLPARGHGLRVPGFRPWPGARRLVPAPDRGGHCQARAGAAASGARAAALPLGRLPRKRCSRPCPRRPPVSTCACRLPGARSSGRSETMMRRGWRHAWRRCWRATPWSSHRRRPLSTAEGWCSKHGLQMTQTHKEGRSWWSHR